MSTCETPIDFFHKGHRDVLAEVRIQRSCGEWAPQVRSRWTKEAVSYQEQLKYTHPELREAISYYAGRIAALRSKRTADFSKAHHDAHTMVHGSAPTIYCPLEPDNGGIYCDFPDCGNDASWACYSQGASFLMTTLCDCCKQERVRMETYSTPDGWDWDDDEKQEDLAFLPIAHREETTLASMKENATALGRVVLPSAFLLGFNLSNTVWPTSHAVMLTELLVVVAVCWQSKNIVRVLFFLSSLMERKNEQN